METNAKTSRASADEARRTRSARSLALAAVIALVAGACHSAATSSSAPSSDQTREALSQTLLGTAQSFAVLGGSTVTNTGPTTVHGNLGVDPGLAVTGFPPGLVSGGTIHSGDGVALQAQNDTVTAYNTLAGQAITAELTGQDLGGKTLTPGVYHFSSSAQLTGALTLNAQGDPNAVFVFQIGSTLTTASNSSVVVINSAEDCNIFWQVGSSATLGTTTAFKGNIIALTSITLNTGAVVSGRTLARNAAVTMDTNSVSMLRCAVLADAGSDAEGGSSGGSSGTPDGSGTPDSSGTSGGSSGTSGTSGGSSGTSGTSGGSSGTSGTSGGSSGTSGTSGTSGGSSGTSGTSGTSGGSSGTSGTSGTSGGSSGTSGTSGKSW